MIRPVSFNNQTHQENKSLSARKLIAWTGQRFGNQAVMSTSFGIQSAVTLHLVSRVIPGLKVIWVDTGYLPDETYTYAQTLTEHLNLDLHVALSNISPSQMELEYGRLWESDSLEDLNRYDQMRKVEPMKQALSELGAEAWISGVRGDQTDFRAGLKPISKSEGGWRIYPILDWTSADVDQYFKRHNLPRHPLEALGFATVGDAHSSRPRGEFDKTDRDTRFSGLKQECGLHLHAPVAKKHESV